MASIVAVARRRSLRSLLAGSIVGGALVVLFRSSRRAPAAQDLSAFDDAPCFRAGPDGRLPSGDGRPVVAPRSEE
jgi:hypothetical protein